VGAEASCRARLDGRESFGKAHCGDGEIDFRGDFRVRWKWADLASAESAEGVLTVVRGGEVLELCLGEAADKWLFQIRNPKSRLDKLGLKTGHSYVARGEFDAEFPAELVARAGEAGSAPFDLVFLRLDDVAGLDRILEARRQIASNGMIWAVWPKGRKELREDDIRNFALANGLVDVKVVSFSPLLSGLKLVIPVALR
jgi:hypothetical protein